MDKILKVPQGLLEAPYNHSGLELEGCKVIESCTHVSSKTGSMFLEDHLLLFVIQGNYTIRYSKQEYTLQRNQMVLLKKAIAIEYLKSGDPANDHLAEYMMFFIKDEFLKEFAQMTNVDVKQSDELVPVSIKTINPQLLAFVQSLKPYFENEEAIDGGLIKLKMLELLYGLASSDKNLMLQLLQLKKQARTDISHILETNYLNPVSLSELAYLSGRSLSSFKRDFQSIYKIPPSTWLREKRLVKAKDLLNTTAMSVTDVCYSVGFENVAHFSRVFKEHFGMSPSLLKSH